MITRLLLILSLLGCFLPCAHSKTPSLLKQLVQLYQHYPHTFLSHCDFPDSQQILVKLCADCPLVPQAIEWMPIIPLKRLAQNKLCYAEKICIDNKGNTYKGIRCCKNDPQFKALLHDLHNYVPELHALIKARKNYEFELNDKSATTHLKVDEKLKRCYVDPKLNGFIARTYLYMHEKYGLMLSSDEIVAFRNWSVKYPASAWELEREKLISRLRTSILNEN